MSQPDFTYRFWSPDGSSHAEQGGFSSAVSAADYQALVNELAEAQALDHERIARIYHLEQALDQALACLDDLKLQVHDQAFLESQLATTEEFAYVQQQAIARLKLQLAQQRQALEAQTAEAQQRDQAVQALLVTTETIAQTQRGELERLRSRLAQDQAKVQAHRSQLEKQLQDLQNVLESRQQRVLELESESLASRNLTASLEIQLETAQQQIRQLCLSLNQHQASLFNLESQLTQSPPAQNAAQNAVTSDAVPVERNLAITQVKVEELEIQLDKQVKLQARLQQNCQELEAERDRDQARIAALERETAEMQEQILEQARQGSEYETAVQHWKDRYQTSQQQMAQLRELLLVLPEHLSNPEAGAAKAALAELLVTVQHLLPTEAADSESPSLPSSRRSPLGIPDFLARRGQRMQ